MDLAELAQELWPLEKLPSVAKDGHSVALRTKFRNARDALQENRQLAVHCCAFTSLSHQLPKQWG
jgi:hypothetical protein